MPCTTTTLTFGGFVSGALDGCIFGGSGWLTGGIAGGIPGRGGIMGGACPAIIILGSIPGSIGIPPGIYLKGSSG